MTSSFPCYYGKAGFLSCFPLDETLFLLTLDAILIMYEWRDIMGLAISLVIAGFAAYWVFNDARSRGNSTTYGAIWAIGVFTFLIIFLPLYLLFGRKSPKRENPREIHDHNTIDVEAKPVEEPDMNCPMCAKPVREDYVACPFCGNTLKPRCANCGRELSRDETECPDCKTPAARK
jgi:uncharacterized membrane protein (DUF485 family)/predicted RNA-binding Zn-ribbon protein involved in translation (DUF1610 family)